MDKNNEIIVNFESALRKQRTRQLLGLYRDGQSLHSGNLSLNNSCNPTEVLTNLSNQIRAIQDADCINSDRRISRSIKISTFLPVTMSPRSSEVPCKNSSSKFETQGVLDTQLLNFIQEVEDNDPRGMTQEFDTTFQHETTEDDEDESIEKNINTPFPIIDISLKEPELNNSIDVIKTETNHPIIETECHIKVVADVTNDINLKTEIINKNEQVINDVTLESTEHIHNYTQPNKKLKFTNEITTKKIECLNDNFEVNTIDSQFDDCTQSFNECFEFENNGQLNVLIKDSDVPSSPILDVKSKKSKTFSPLVFNLDTFESFEQIALPAVEQCPNLETAKLIINSQIIGKELHINTCKRSLLTAIDLDLATNKMDDRISPIIPLNQDDLKVEKLDELLKIPKKSNDHRNTNLFEDEILFSSDEEVDSELKPEDLPFTCALETSFYEQVDVLDKTMYVGFQTASNKSIQICTDSFSKAIDILDLTKDLGKEEPHLKELVNLCESKTKNECAIKEEETLLKNPREEMEVDAFDIIQSQVIPYSAFSKRSTKTNKQNECPTINKVEKTLIQHQKEGMYVDSDDIPDIVQSQILHYSKQNNKYKKQTDKLKLNPQKDFKNLITTDNSVEFKTSIEKSSDAFRELEKTSSHFDIAHQNKENKFEVQLTSKHQYEEQMVLMDPINGNQILKGVETAFKNEKSLPDDGKATLKEVFQDIDLKDCLLDSKSNKACEKIHNNITNTLKYRQDSWFVNEGKEISISKQKDVINKSSLKMEGQHMIKQFDNKMKQKDAIDINKSTKDLSYVTTSNNAKIAQLLGFRTASNKDIQISNNAVQKTKTIFQDLMENGSSVLQNNPFHKNKSMKETTEHHKENTILDKLSIHKEIKNKGFPDIGFKTASNKNIEITEKAWVKTKSFFNDINDIQSEDTLAEICHNKESEIALTPSNTLKRISDNNLLQAKSKFTEQILVSDSKATNTAFPGFKMANNKEITVSKDALLKTIKIFHDVDNEELIKPTINVKSSMYPILETNNNKENKATDFNKSTLKEFEEEIFEESSGFEIDEEPPFYGFHSVNDEEVRLFEEAMANSGVLEEFKEYPQETNADKKGGTVFGSLVTLKPEFQGFRTASDKAVEISARALAKSKKILQDIDIVDRENIQNTLNENITSTVKFQGFKTAGKKPVEMSDEAVAKSKKIFEDISARGHEKIEEYANENTSFQGFQISGNKIVTNSAQVLAKSKTIFHDTSVFDEFQLKVPISHNIIPPSSTFKCFKTASNKPVNISAEALARSKNIFQDIDLINIEEPQIILNGDMPSTSKFQGFQTASNKKVIISEAALAESKMIFHNIHTAATDIEKNTFQGFRTASNKYLKISEEALTKSKKIFQDIDNINLEINVAPSRVHGFQTTSNKELKISKDWLARSKKVLEKIDKDIHFDNNASNTGFQGFQTASNKEVIISEKALAKSKKIFQDIDIVKNQEQVEGISLFKDFQSANNKDVKISAEALARSKRIFQDIDDNKHSDQKGTTFKGFETASNKKVKISEEALAKSRKLFQDIELDIELPINLQGFKTASNKNVEISKEAFEMSRKVFQDVDIKHSEFNKYHILKSEIGNLDLDKKSNIPNNVVKEKNMVKTIFEDEANIESIINTQLIDNFEKSLHTEDFCTSETTTRVSKRSGSPILSCPKAKRRKKFEIPYSQKVVDDKFGTPKHGSPKLVEISKNVIKFNEKYKKSKIYSLKDLHNIEKENSDVNPEIDNYILKFTFETLLSFEFIQQRNDVSDTKLTIIDLKNIFQQNVNKKLIPDGWLDINIKLILWKLISYEIRFPKTMEKVTTAKNVLDQLKYRYNRELYNAERPALRKIMEKDDTSCKTLILCIVAVLADGKVVPSVPQNYGSLELLVTDGWYSIRASTDRMLSKHVSSGRLYVGCKIVTHGAEVTGCEQGVAPWEDTSSIRLKLFGNSTRRARWDSRLGYHSTAAILSPLSSVMADGGKISKLRLFVTRVYPALYVEKFDDGSTVTRSERLELLHQMKYETDRQALMEKLYEEVEREISDDQDSQESEGMTGGKTKNMDSSQIAKIMKRTEDPVEFLNLLTSSQTILLQDHSNRERERLLQQIQTRVQDKMAKLGLQQARNVIPLLKIRVVGVDLKKNIRVTKAFLSIWKPNDAVLEIIKEGIWVEVMNVIPTAVRFSEIQISAGRQSVFSHSKYKETEKDNLCLQPLKRICHPIKDLVNNPSLVTEYNEIDTVGFIFLIDPIAKEFDSNKHQFQNVYLTDVDKNIICVYFWGGLKKFGFENILDTGQIIACTNLQKRAGNTRKNIPQFRVTEFSYFTKSPKHEIARKSIEEMSKIFSNFNKPKFIEDCTNLRQNYAAVKLHSNENISPYRMPNIDINTSKNKIFVDSPLAQKYNTMDESLNLSGLDFESTFKQTETQELSPRTLIRKQQIKDKIAKLKMYGEPPPLSPIQFLNKSKNAGNAFKSPFLKSDVSSSVANEKYAPNQLDISEKTEDTVIQRSPVIMNRSYVKRFNVNPVKLSFENNAEESNKSKVIDDFGEEFDGSLPLSLE